MRFDYRMRSALARWIAPPSRRMYEAARNTRLTSGWYAANNSADSELVSSLTALRARSRALCRDASYAKRAKVVVVNNVIGSGIGMQAQVMNQRGRLLTDVNDAIESAWNEWARAPNCHTGGRLHFADLERLALGQIFEAGEIFLRKHYRTFGESKVPLAIEVIEAERIAEEYEAPEGTTELVRMGVSIDSFGRPVAYWVKIIHPGEIRFRNVGPEDLIRVPASQMFHLAPIYRWPMTRGEPWLHSAAGRLNDMNGYSEAEIVAARGAASYMGIVESPDAPPVEPDATQIQQQFQLEPGTTKFLGPGEKFNFVAPNRPNPQMDPFMRMMLREVAAGVGVSYESLSRDYSQSNYSSSRLALLDDRDLWRTLQQWFIRSFREPLHREWLQSAVMSGAIEAIPREAYALQPDKYNAVTFKPRGWSWIDPVKEVEAFATAVRSGFTTVSNVIAQTGDGRDLEDVLRERRRELDLMDELEIETETEVQEPPEPAAAPIPAAQDSMPSQDPMPAQDSADQTDSEDSADAARVLKMRARK